MLKRVQFLKPPVFVFHFFFLLLLLLQKLANITYDH